MGSEASPPAEAGVGFAVGAGSGSVSRLEVSGDSCSLAIHGAVW